jgi:pentatricopeptide repeat protein
VLLGTLAKVAETGALFAVEPLSSSASNVFDDVSEILALNTELHSLQQKSSLFEVVRLILNAMSERGQIDDIRAPIADSQTFCVAASALQHGPTSAILSTEMYHNATKLGVSTDGRFLNALLRCFGNEVDAALVIWKDEIRPQCISFENRIDSSNKKNLIAAYQGLLYVCGRALRPDVALRVVYAMSKDGLEPNEASLNSYRSGSKIQKLNEGDGFRLTLERKLKLIEQYESLLFVECTKYDCDDRRRTGERRVRIIL